MVRWGGLDWGDVVVGRWSGLVKTSWFMEQREKLTLETFLLDVSDVCSRSIWLIICSMIDGGGARKGRHNKDTDTVGKDVRDKFWRCVA